jgi:hypothetical protein
MIRLFARLTVTVTLAMAGLVFGLRAANGFIMAAPDTLPVFAQPDCGYPCWNGIEPGVSTAEDTIAYLQAQGLPYTTPPISSTSDQLISTGHDGVDFVIPYRQDVVAGVFLSTPNCPANVIYSAGLPPFIVFTLDGNVFAVYPERHFAVYFERKNDRLFTKTTMLATSDRLYDLLSRETLYGGRIVRWRDAAADFRKPCPTEVASAS